MRVTFVVSLLLLVAFAAIGECKLGQQGSYSIGFAKPRSVGSRYGKRSSAGIYKDMLLHNVYTRSSRDSSGALKHAVACKSYSSRMAKRKNIAGRALAKLIHKSVSWSDPNSNSSTCCTTSWLDSTNSTNYPTSYIFCDTTSSPETWQWYFSSYVSGSNFTLQLAHQFKDPS
jgi:hypothetical protein